MQEPTNRREREGARGWRAWLVLHLLTSLLESKASMVVAERGEPEFSSVGLAPFFSLLVAWAGLFDPLVCVERENARITGKCGFCGWSLRVVALSVCRPTGEYAWPSGFRATSSSFFVWILSRLAFLQACGQLSRLAEGERGRSAGNGICWAGEKRRGSCSYRCVLTTGRRPMTEEEGSCSALMACFPRSRGSQTSRRRR